MSESKESAYPWDKAPEWAQWAATDPDGALVWSESKLTIPVHEAFWINCGGNISRRITPMGTKCLDWRETLEQRPQPRKEGEVSELLQTQSESQDASVAKTPETRASVIPAAQSTVVDSAAPDTSEPSGVWLEDFQAEQWAWVQETFPGEQAEGVLKHLIEEWQEFLTVPTDPRECADIFLLLQCWCSHYGINLMQAARAKFEECKKRTWVNIPGKGFRHATDPEPSGVRLEVGKKYRTEEGLIYGPMKVSDIPGYDFMGRDQENITRYYTATGKYNHRGIPCSADIIAEWTDPAPVAEPNCGRGWRWLEVGEIIKVGDESTCDFEEFIAVPEWGSVKGEPLKKPFSFRRRVTPAPAPECLCPEYAFGSIRSNCPIHGIGQKATAPEAATVREWWITESQSKRFLCFLTARDASGYAHTYGTPPSIIRVHDADACDRARGAMEDKIARLEAELDTLDVKMEEEVCDEIRQKHDLADEADRLRAQLSHVSATSSAYRVALDLARIQLKASADPFDDACTIITKALEENV